MENFKKGKKANVYSREKTIAVIFLMLGLNFNLFIMKAF